MTELPHHQNTPSDSDSGDAELDSLAQRLNGLGALERATAGHAFEDRILAATLNAKTPGMHIPKERTAHTLASLSEKTGTHSFSPSSRRAGAWWRQPAPALAAAALMILSIGGISFLFRPVSPSPRDMTGETLNPRASIPPAPFPALDEELDTWFDPDAGRPMVQLAGWREFVQDLETMQRTLTDPWPTEVVYEVEESL